ncbi:16S rRNA (guanine(527)-N(7))-methyltransferase RsmG [Actinotalea sp.]|uniref:16S rRNA (guanine(527)-N(7))-methyltransferase RsmG n=1 Tax=Actinotalea sp. TaxID=1872145 RepID=UPI0035675E3C
MEHHREDEGDPGVDAADPQVVAFLGQAHAAVAAFGEALTAEGVLRGLLGPREIPRLWERHLLNSAAVAALLPETGTLVDVGSGAGLPGVVLAAMRPRMRVVLLEPMERRVAWLEHVTALVGLDNVEVLRGRAEDVTGALHADVVTARAVAPMARLAGWTLPLLVQGGVLLALKGRQAGDELAAASAELARYGGDAGEVLQLPSVPEVDPTTVVRVHRTSIPVAAPATGGGRTGRSSSRAVPGRGAEKRTDRSPGSSTSEGRAGSRSSSAGDGPRGTGGRGSRPRGPGERPSGPRTP